ncbi:MAG: hypothetical protein L6435_02575 [Anaerolineae bacterium]|nr:hypothetical protein [Anaerolineae bacterium]
MPKKTATKEGKWVWVKCAFCKGTGKDPFKVLSPLSNCPACGEKGKALVQEAYKTCPDCGGTGLRRRTRLYCWTCHGKGVVPE